MTPTQPPHTHTYPTPNLGGCEEDLSNERRGLLHRGQTHRRTDGHRDSMTESAQWANSVKMLGETAASTENQIMRLDQLISFTRQGDICKVCVTKEVFISLLHRGAKVVLGEEILFHPTQRAVKLH